MSENISVTHGVASLSEARAQMYRFLQELDRPVKVTELIKLLGQHRNTVRGHIDALVTSGLVIAEPASSSGERGRPSMLYRVNKKLTQSKNEYEQLASLLAAQLESQAGSQEIAKQLGSLWASQLLAQAHKDGSATNDPMEILRHLGTGPEMMPDGRTILLRSCPLSDVASDHPNVICTMHGSMVRSMLERRGNIVNEQHVYPETVLGGCHLVILPRVTE
ncbi:MAG: helix-turn-helix transcriptional regulator [Propionibacteriaceae bacterium]